MALMSFYIKLIRLDQKRVGLASLSGKIRISKGIARLAEPVRCISGRAPDNQKTLTWLSVYHALLADYRGLTGGFLLLQNFCVAISVSPHVCFSLVLILISMFLR